MKRSIRRGIFETNSSSTHAMTICTKAAYDKWNTNEDVFMDGRGNIKTLDEMIEMAKMSQYFTPDILEDKEEMYEFFRDNFDYENSEMFNFWLERYEDFYQEYETPGGEKIVAFGYSGYDN